MTGNSFIGNQGQLFGGAGGNLADNSAVFTNNIFIGNSALYGGALDAEPLVGFLYIAKNTFINNTATFGGAIDTFAESGPINIIDNLFVNNSSTYGGAYYDQSEGVVNGSPVPIALPMTGNRFVNNTATKGNSIWLDGSLDSVNGETNVANWVTVLTISNHVLSDDIFIL